MQSWRTTKRWIVLLRICVLLSGGLSALHFDQRLAHAIETTPDSRGQKYSIAEIRAKLREQLTSIHSIWCEYKVQSSSAYDRTKPDTWPTVIWAQQNSRILHHLLPHQPKNGGGNWREQFESFDGRTGFQVLFREDARSRVQMLHRWNSNPPRLLDRLNPAHHLGLLVKQSPANLIGLIDRPGVSIQPGVQIAGHETVMVDLGSYESQGVTTNILRVFLDPEFDFLPRQIESLPARLLAEQKNPGASKTFEGQPGDALWQIGVESFFEVEDFSGRRKRWFPHRLTHSGQTTAVVEKVRLNEDIPITAFQPILTETVTIIDNPGTPQVRETIHKTPIKSQETGSVETHIDEALTAKREPLIVADLSNRVSISNVLIVTTFILISVACIVARHRT